MYGYYCFPSYSVELKADFEQSRSGQMGSWTDRFGVESFCFAGLDSTIWKTKPVKPLLRTDLNTEEQRK